VVQRIREKIESRIPFLKEVKSWDQTGGLPPPPVVDLHVAKEVVVQANIELALLSEFIHRVDKLGIDILGELVPPLHHVGIFEHARPVAADDFLQLQGLASQAALAQHYGIPTRLLDWSDDPLVAAFFSAWRPDDRMISADRVCVWGLNEDKVAAKGINLWGSVGLSLQIIRPKRSNNAYLRAQRGVFTFPWGAGCYALVNNGVYPSIEDFVRIVARGNSNSPLLRCITLPASMTAELLSALERRWVTLDDLMPSAQTVARQITGGR